MKIPELTVLMTVRNGEPYVKQAVASILGQTYEDFRFLILDNASTDNSREVVRAFKDRRIELVELPEDIGQTAALNRGLRMIETPWVARMDADDVSLPRRLEMQMAYLLAHPETVLLGTGVRWIDGSGDLLNSPLVAVSDADVRWLHYIGHGGIAHSSVVFSGATAKEVGGYPSEYRHPQDYALWFLMLEKGRVANLPEALVLIRRHGTNTTVPELAERELRTILQQRLSRLFPGEPAELRVGLARALRYDRSVALNKELADALRALLVRFHAKHSVHPSDSLRREYAERWLYMARVASLHEQGRGLGWFRLALSLDRTLCLRPGMWRTLASVALAPIRRRAAVSPPAPSSGRT